MTILTDGGTEPVWSPDGKDLFELAMGLLVQDDEDEEDDLDDDEDDIDEDEEDEDGDGGYPPPGWSD